MSHFPIQIIYKIHKDFPISHVQQANCFLTFPHPLFGAGADDGGYKAIQ